MAKPARSLPSLPLDPVIIAVALSAAAQVTVTCLPGLPLGVPGEWVWTRIPYGPVEAAMLFLGLLGVLPAAILYVIVCRWGDRRFAASGPKRRAVWLLGLVAAGFGWLWVLQDSVPHEYNSLGRGPLVLYYPGTSGYFNQALEADDFTAYLADYEELMAEGDVLHLGTHPPGLIVLHRALLGLYRSSPALVEATLLTRPASVRATEEVIVSMPVGGTARATRAELAELWGASLLMQLAAVATLVPLFICVQRTCGSVAGWRTACLWPIVTGLAVFLPKADALYPLVGMTVIALWFGASPPGIVRSVIAGGVFWFGTMLSLAMLPVALFAGFLSLQSMLVAEPPERRSMLIRTLRDAGIVLAVFAALTGIIGYVFKLDLIAVWNWNLRNHAAFYDSYVRTYWKWLLINPVELTMTLGLPVAVCAFMSLCRSWSIRSVAAPIAIVIAALWLSGKNSGEAARLWLFMTPWLLWIAADVWKNPNSRQRWHAVLYAQLIVAIVTAVRISGFGFADLLDGAG